MKEAKWKFASNHLLVLAQLVDEPTRRQRDIAAALGITEGSVQRILAELVETGYVHTRRVGRRNHYQIDNTALLRHPLSSHVPVSRLVEMIAGENGRTTSSQTRPVIAAIAKTAPRQEDARAA